MISLAVGLRQHQPDGRVLNYYQDGETGTEGQTTGDLSDVALVEWRMSFASRSARCLVLVALFRVWSL
jgi:hypothetical protein